MPVVSPTLHCLKFPWSVAMVPFTVKANGTIVTLHGATGVVGGRPSPQAR
jgi:hypothetical protein